jgi:hypothetical protein
MALANGTDIGVYQGGTLIAGLTSNDISFEHALRDATTKDSSGNSEYLEGLRDASISFEGYYNDVITGQTFEELYTLYSGRSTATFRWSSTTTSDKYYEGTGYIESLGISAPLEETTTFTGSVKITGAVTQGAVS